MGHILGLHRNDVCAPWRILTPFAALARVGYDVRCGLIERESDLDPWADLLVLHSPGTSDSIRLVRQARSAGIPVVADFDDAFFRHDRATGSATEQFGEFLRDVDTVTVSTQLLASLYQPFNDTVRVLPNCFDETTFAWTEPAVPRERLHIGFAGSGFHEANLSLIVEPLQCVLRSHPEVRVVEAGGPNLLPQLNVAAEQLLYLGWQPFDGFPLLLRQMDIVLAPLADVPFNYGKSNVRCMTAGLVGAPVVASPVGAYAEYVEHGSNGFLAQTEAEWVDALEQLIMDSELRQRMGQANRECAENYAIGAHVSQWQATYDPLLNHHCETPA